MQRTREAKEVGDQSRGICLGFTQPLLKAQLAHLHAHLLVALPDQVGIELRVVVHLLCLLPRPANVCLVRLGDSLGGGRYPTVTGSAFGRTGNPVILGNVG